MESYAETNVPAGQPLAMRFGVTNPHNLYNRLGARLRYSHDIRIRISGAEMLRFAAIILLSTLGSAPANAASQADSRPQVLSTQRGLTDGKREATVLHTEPLARGGVITTPPYDQQINGAAQYPLIIAPYIQVPGYTPQPNPPRPAPHFR